MDKKQEEQVPAVKKITRRRFLATSSVVIIGAVLTACGINLGSGTTKSPESSPTKEPSTEWPKSTSTMEATPACGSPEEMTPAVTEGPYFTPNSPERSTLLESGMKGTKLTVSGYVLSTDCKPVARALLDFWQADSSGQYDNKGFTLRGHQYTDDKGKFTLETVVPGLYPGRTRHIHVKVQAPNKEILTTQLFFPNEAGNAKDGIYKKELLLNVKSNTDGSQLGTFDFVLRL